MYQQFTREPRATKLGEKHDRDIRILSLSDDQRRVHVTRAESPVYQISRCFFFLKGMYSLMAGYELHFLWGNGHHNL